MIALQILYFLAGILFIAFSTWSMGGAAFIVKAMLMPLLMLYFHTGVKGRYTLLYILVMVALLFSLFGDVLLQVPARQWGIPHLRDELFIAGLGAFLVTQLLYTVAFLLPGESLVMRTDKSSGPPANVSSRTRPAATAKDSSLDSAGSRQNEPSGIRPKFSLVILSKEAKPGEKAIGVLLLLMVVGYSGLLYGLLFDGLGVMKVPVAAYTVVITAMLLAALNRYGKVGRVSFLLVAAGAALFVASDSLIAINRFHTKLDHATLSVMSTYVIAQYLIVRGCLSENRNPQPADRKA